MSVAHRVPFVVVLSVMHDFVLMLRGVACGVVLN